MEEGDSMTAILAALWPGFVIVGALALIGLWLAWANAKRSMRK